MNNKKINLLNNKKINLLRDVLKMSVPHRCYLISQISIIFVHTNLTY